MIYEPLAGEMLRAAGLLRDPPDTPYVSVDLPRFILVHERTVTNSYGYDSDVQTVTELEADTLEEALAEAASYLNVPVERVNVDGEVLDVGPEVGQP